MEKGWGLTLENSDGGRLMGSKSVFGYNLNQGSMFPVDQPLAQHSVFLGEVDFFSEKKRQSHHEVNRFVKKEYGAGELDVNVSVN